MQVIIEAFSYRHAQECLKLGCPHLIVGNAEFASRLSYSFSQSEIEHLCKHKKATKLWVKVNAFFFEQQLPVVTAYLQWLAQIGIDYVIFQDYAIAQINVESKLGLKLHYNPESLVTSFGQLEFYTNNKFSGCFLARELSLNEIQAICQHKNGLLLEVQGFGFGLIMHSRWSLITNFQDFYHTEVEMPNESIWIKEKLRKIPNLIFEDNHGTHMLTGYLINALEKIQALADAGVDLLQINFLKLDEQLASRLTTFFMQVISAAAKHEFKFCDYLLTLQAIIADRFLLSLGFLDSIKELPHLEKEQIHD